MQPYPLHPNRTLHLLDGIWDFAFLGDVEPDSIDVEDLNLDDSMPVPGVFDSTPNLAGKRGLSVWRTRIEATPGSEGWLDVQGMGLWGRFYVDGEALGTCELPYCPWSLRIPASEKSERELLVIVDNRFGDRALLFDPYFDFYAYGGFYRSVIWHELPPRPIDRARIDTLDLRDGRVAVELMFHESWDGTISLDLLWDEVTWEKDIQVEVSQGRARFEALVPFGRPWSPDQPYLHTLRIDTPDDSIVERFGLRTVEAKGGEIFVNGAAIKLLGFNRHEAHPQFGPALPLAQHHQDLQIIANSGSNFIRGSHYQQDQRFLDLCDEQGMLVWEEGLGWQAGEAHFANPRFAELQAEQCRLMIRRSINHPSVIMWGFLNEGESQRPQSVATYEAIAKACREEDLTRPLTYACNHPTDCQNLHLADIISINQYPGWYAHDTHLDRPLEEIDSHITFLLKHFQESPHSDKPFIISEMGAGAIYGWRDPHKAHWSEEYQSDYLEILCRRCATDEAIAGLAIWQYCDGRTYSHSRALGRPRTFNNKGVVDEYRRPKAAYHTVSEIFKSGH